MTFTAQDYDGFTLANKECVRTGPFGEVADYQIVDAPVGMKTEIGCWLTLPTNIVTTIN